MSSTRRIEWIDSAKGIGIVLVILGHIHFCPPILKNFLCAFHMPLFFWLAGVTFKPEKYDGFKALIKDKVRKIVIPYFVFALCLVFWDVVQGMIKAIVRSTEFPATYHLKQFVGVFINIRGTDYGPGVWFLTCIFCCYIILFFLLKKNNNSMRVLLSGIIFIVGFVYAKLIDIKLPWAIDASFIAVFFMYAGYCSKNYLNKIKAIKIYYRSLIFLFFFGTTIIVSSYNARITGTVVDMWDNTYGNVLLYIAGSLSGILMTFFAVNISRFGFFTSIGKRSLYYYGIHIIFVQISVKAFQYINSRIPAFIGREIIETIVCLVATLIGTTIVLPIFERIIKTIDAKFFISFDKREKKNLSL